MLDLYRFPLFEKQKHLLHGVTTKSKLFPYQFSLALHTGEEHYDILQNREQLTNVYFDDKYLNFIVANQTHSDHVKHITQAQTRGWEEYKTSISDCDALITNVPNIILTILTADCVPILLYDKNKQVIAAVHAGWKGTNKKILMKTIEEMIQIYGCNTQDIIAGIGPSIGKCCYEVNHDVAKFFAHIPHAYTIIKDKYMLDLPYINKQQLLNIGIKKENIELSNICTSCKVERFFSYRKELGCSGRFMSMIGIKPSSQK